jgi:hypothetical protein
VSRPVPPVCFAGPGIEIARFARRQLSQSGTARAGDAHQPQVCGLLSARASFAEISGNDEASQLSYSIAASGEARGGGENSHIVTALLGNRGLTVVAVPADTDYTIRLENAGAPEPGR